MFIIYFLSYVKWCTSKHKCKIKSKIKQEFEICPKNFHIVEMKICSYKSKGIWHIWNKYHP